jgi:hypothetical protein
VAAFGGDFLAWWFILTCRKELGMQIREDFELLEFLFIELDPLEDGFAGVLLEIYRHEDRYVLLVVAAATGNRLLRFSSEDRGLLSAVLAGELGGLLGGEGPHKSRSW